MNLLIAHDLGTTGNKATLFSSDGILINSVTYPYKTNFFRGNCAEQNPEDWWNAVCNSTKILLQDRDKSEVKAVSFSGQMMGCVCIGKNGRPLCDAIIWADMRSTIEEEYIRSKLDEHMFYRITGHRISASYSIEKLMWIRANKPEIFADTYKMLLPKDYIILRLTGQYITDFSDASGTNAFDLNRLMWSQEILDACKLDMSILPNVFPSTYIAGEVTANVSEECGLPVGTKVVIGGGDGSCAAVGAMSISENIAYNYLGSSAWVAYTSRKPLFDEEMRTFNWAHIVPGYYLPTGTMQAAGNSFNFVRNTLCNNLPLIAKEKDIDVYTLINEMLLESKAGANGLVFLPYLLGERSPRWNPSARGAFIGLNMEHTQADILRSTIEGILMNMEIILKIFSNHTNIEQLNVIGGLAQSNPIMQILASIYGLSANKLSHLEEATSMGAAVTAGVGIGLLSGFEDIKRFISVDEKIFPNNENFNCYKTYKQIFNDCYLALYPIYEMLHKERI